MVIARVEVSQLRVAGLLLRPQAAHAERRSCRIYGYIVESICSSSKSYVIVYISSYFCFHKSPVRREVERSELPGCHSAGSRSPALE